MVHDAQASSDDSDTDSSGTDDDADSDSDSDGSPNSDQDDNRSDSDDSSDGHQGHHYEPPHEADRSYNGVLLPHRPQYSLVNPRPSPSTSVEGPANRPGSNAHGSDTSILRVLLQSEETLTSTTTNASSPGNAEGSGGKQESGAICCSTM